MIGWLVKLLTGAGLGATAGPWIILAVVLAVGTAGGFAGYEARGLIDGPRIAQAQTAAAVARAATAQCVAQHEKARADGAEKAVSALQAAAGDVAAATSRLASQDVARQAATTVFLKDLANVPKTTVCGGSAAELAYRRSVQPHQ